MTAASRTEHFDVVIAGAGISGIAAAYHLDTQCPGTSFVVLEAQESFGGTWRTHRYPGIRSDSDLYTFGYRFKPWTGAPIATAADILRYMGEVIDENQLGAHIRYRHTIVAASWSSREKCWTLETNDTTSGEMQRFTAGFLWMCQGYYRHAAGYTPDWDGMADFEGRIVHPQTWPVDLDYRGKKVVVIGSGATAATLIPAKSFRVLSRPMARPLSTAPGGMASRWMSFRCAREKWNRVRSNWKTLTCWRSPPPTNWRSCAIVNILAGILVAVR